MRHITVGLSLLVATLAHIGDVAPVQTALAEEASMEDFETGHEAGKQLRGHADWFYEEENDGPVAVESGGVGDSWGLSVGERAFTWTAKPFSWSEPTLKAVVVGGDWQTSEAGWLDDDRAGWSISDEDDSSDNIFGVQIDPKGEVAVGGPTPNIEAYWDGSTFGDDGCRTSIVTLPALKPKTWYRMRATFTKLTPSSAKIDVTFVELGDDKQPAGEVHEGSLADSSKLSGSEGNQQPNEAYFATETVWPVYKNYTAVEGGFDNAYFMIERSDESPGDAE